jgi:hypothetical protein
MARQEITGFRFDIAKGIALKQQLEADMEAIRAICEPQFPSRKLNKTEESKWTLPSKPFKQDGSYSASLLAFVARNNLQIVNGKILVEQDQFPIIGNTCIKSQTTMTLANQDDLKEWLVSQGWKPTLWNFKKDAKGKPVKENGKLMLTTPKLQDKGKLCPNLEAMAGPLIRDVVKWLSLRNRLAVLTGWLEHPRLAIDGRLPAGSSGITPTFRQKHTVVVNVPKAEAGVLYGKEFRSLFIADEGMVLVGADAAALEARVTGHYTAKYDNGEYGRELLEGDIHSKNAWVFYKDELQSLGLVQDASNKEDSRFKPSRSKSKNGAYCLAYGGSAKKLAETLGISDKRGEDAYNAYWKANWALARFKDAVVKYWKDKGEKKYVVAIDGRTLCSRSEHSLVNLLFQSCGAIAMDLALCLFDKALGGNPLDENGLPTYTYKGKKVRRVGFFHDELQVECHPEVADEIGQLIVDCIKQAGVMLNMRIPLDGEYKIADNWAGTH